MTVEELAKALGGAKFAGGSNWMAFCPSHNDTKPSLSISQGHSKIIFRCVSRGCAQDDIVTGLKDQGLWPLERTDAQPSKRTAPAASRSSASNKGWLNDWTILSPIPDDAPPIPQTDKEGTASAQWIYRSADDRILGVVQRFEKKEGGKLFKPQTLARNKASGALRWLRVHMPNPRPLYGLDRLAKRPDLPVLLVEGEKCADIATRILGNYVSVTWEAGADSAISAGHIDWAALKDREVVIWPDNDIPGKKAAISIKAALDKIAASCRIIDPPEIFPKKADIADCEIDGWDAKQIATFVESGSIPPRAFGVSREVEDKSNPHFVPLGLDRDHTYYYRSIKNPRVLAIPAGAHTNHSLMMTLAPLNFWESRYMGRTGVDWQAASDETMRRCKARGAYNPEHVRGRGAWIEDDNRLVFHTGGQLFVDNKRHELHEFKSRYSYEIDWDLGLDFASVLPDNQARKIIEVCKELAWRKPISGVLLAGWIVLAPFSGALRWRPHIWLSGEAGSGKSYILTDIIRPLVAIAEFMEGGSTGAGVRQSLNNDSRPVLYDEAERTNNVSDARLQELLDLIMIASSGEGNVKKGTTSQKATSTQIRSCFCLASINTALDRQGIARRMTALELRKNGNPGQFKKLKMKVAALPAGAALIARTMRNFKVLVENIKTFNAAIGETLKDQPAADQIGPMLAGAYLLERQTEITLDQARQYIEALADDWKEQVVSEEDRDGSQLVTRLLGYLVRISLQGGPVERTVGELILTAMGIAPDGALTAEQARHQLLRMGVLVETDLPSAPIAIANRNSELEKIFRNTQWAHNWHDAFERLDGAKRAKLSFASGRRQPSVTVPHQTLFAVEAQNAGEASIFG